MALIQYGVVVVTQWYNLLCLVFMKFIFIRYLHLPLMDAERAWATAMQLKSEANTEPRKRFHMLSRLRKALQHADLLVKLCESNKCDARTKLEAQVKKTVPTIYTFFLIS